MPLLLSVYALEYNNNKINLHSYTTRTVIDNCEPMMLLLGKAQTETTTTTTKHNNPNNLRLLLNENNIIITNKTQIRRKLD